MHELPIAWIRHVAQQLGTNSPVVRGALRAARLNPALLTDETTRVDAQQVHRLPGARRPPLGRRHVRSEAW